MRNPINVCICWISELCIENFVELYIFYFNLSELFYIQQIKQF